MRSFKRALQTTLDASKVSVGLRPYLAKQRWAEVVGEQVAEVTEVEGMIPGAEPGTCVLVVRTRNSVWSNELSLLKEDILRRLNDAQGARVLVDIRFKAIGLSQKGREHAKPPTERTQDAMLSVELTPADLDRIEASTEHIDDPELRMRVMRSLDRSLRTDTWKRSQGWLPCERCGSLAMPKLPTNLEGHGRRRGRHLCDVCVALAGA